MKPVRSTAAFALFVTIGSMAQAANTYDPAMVDERGCRPLAGDDTGQAFVNVKADEIAFNETICKLDRQYVAVKSMMFQSTCS